MYYSFSLVEKKKMCVQICKQSFKYTCLCYSNKSSRNNEN